MKNLIAILLLSTTLSHAVLAQNGNVYFGHSGGFHNANSNADSPAHMNSRHQKKAAEHGKEYHREKGHRHRGRQHQACMTNTPQEIQDKQVQAHQLRIQLRNLMQQSDSDRNNILMVRDQLQQLNQDVNNWCFEQKLNNRGK